MQINRSREIKTAILVILSIVLFIWGYNFLKGKNILNPHLTLYVEYPSVEGLQPSSPITLNGMVIGRVNSISIQENTGKPLVELQINEEFPISKSSVAKLYDASVLGGKQVAIIPNFADKTALKTGDHIKGEVELGMMENFAKNINPLQSKVESAISNIDVLVTNLNKVLDQESRENLKSSLASLSTSLKSINQITQNTNQLITDNKAKLNHSIDNFDKISTNFSKISDSLAQANLGQTVKNLDASLAEVNKIMQDIQQGKGSMGKLMKDEKMYNNLTAASKELELLLADMKTNPKRYVHFSLFGKKPTTYQPENDTIKKLEN